MNTQLTRSERHRIYFNALQELKILKDTGKGLFICNIIQNILLRDHPEYRNFNLMGVYEPLDKAGITNELAKYKPSKPFARTVWFHGTDFDSRYAVLNSLIDETAGPDTNALVNFIHRCARKFIFMFRG